MREHTKKNMVQSLYKAGMSKSDIINGMKEVYSVRYDKSRLDRDLQGISAKDRYRETNYLKDIQTVKQAYRDKIISKKVYETYMKEKPAKMVIGYSISNDVNLKTMKPKYKDKLNEFYEYNFYWLEGSP